MDRSIFVFLFPRAFLPRTSRPIPLSPLLPPFIPAFLPPSRLAHPPSTALRLSPLESALPRFDPHTNPPPHSRERFHPAAASKGGGDRGKTESESQGWGVSMAEARGQGERAGSPTLTSNKGGELMRAGARADTCGYRPTPAIKPSAADPRKTLELNPPRRLPQPG